jgi:hypothetical protein
MTENLTRSTEIGKLVTALAKAQLTFDPIIKESENPAFRRGNKVSKYADMFSLVNATRKHLNNNGLTIMQFPSITLEGKNLIVTTLLAHESGEWIASEIVLPAVDERGFTAHSIGKAITYARRYSWGSIIGAVAEDDDDGNDISGQGTHEAAQAVANAKLAEYAAKAGKTVDELKQDLDAKKAKKSAPVASNSQQTYIPSLFYAIQPSGLYAVEGDKSLLEKLWKPYQKFWLQQDRCYMVNEEVLEQIKFQCESNNPPIPFTPLKAAQ